MSKHRITSEEINTHTGEVLSSKTKVVSISKFSQSSFIKLAVIPLKNLADMHRSEILIFMYLSGLVNERNRVPITSQVRDDLLTQIGMHKNSFPRCIKDLSNKGIIKRINKHFWMVNPYLATRTKSEFEDNLKKEWDML